MMTESYFWVNYHFRLRSRFLFAPFYPVLNQASLEWDPARTYVKSKLFLCVPKMQIIMSGSAASMIMFLAFKT